jgi:hypothetical protein
MPPRLGNICEAIAVWQSGMHLWYCDRMLDAVSMLPSWLCCCGCGWGCALLATPGTLGGKKDEFTKFDSQQQYTKRKREKIRGGLMSKFQSIPRSACDLLHDTTGRTRWSAVPAAVHAGSGHAARRADTTGTAVWDRMCSMQPLRIQSYHPVGVWQRMHAWYGSGGRGKRTVWREACHIYIPAYVRVTAMRRPAAKHR